MDVGIGARRGVTALRCLRRLSGYATRNSGHSDLEIPVIVTEISR
jgi:hypothetical protein